MAQIGEAFSFRSSVLETASSRKPMGALICDLWNHQHRSKRVKSVTPQQRSSAIKCQHGFRKAHYRGSFNNDISLKILLHSPTDRSPKALFFYAVTDNINTPCRRQRTAKQLPIPLNLSQIAGCALCSCKPRPK